MCAVQVKTNDFSDVSQYYIDRALPMAIARVRDIARTSPPEAVDALVDALIHEDNRGNLYDDCGFLVGLLQASGHLVPHNQQVDYFQSPLAIYKTAEPIVACKGMSAAFCSSLCPATWSEALELCMVRHKI